MNLSGPKTNYYNIVQYYIELFLFLFSEEIFRCFKKNTDKPINITLNCKASQAVNVIDAKYGHNRWSACLSAVAPGDCTETMFEAEKCNKQKICKLSVNHIYSFKCGEINYFRIMYSCNEGRSIFLLNFET